MRAVVIVPQLVLALVQLGAVIGGGAGGFAALGVLQAIGGIHVIGHARNCHWRYAVFGNGVAQVGGVVAGLLARRYFQVDSCGLWYHGSGLGQALIREHDGGALQGLCQPHCPLGAKDAVGGVQCSQYQMWGVTVHTVEGDIEVGLFRFGGDAGGGAAAHDIDHHHWCFRCDRQAQAFEHQRQPWPRGGGHCRYAAVRRANYHVDGGQFIFRLQQAAPQLFQPWRQPLQHVAGGGDRISRRKTDATPQGAETASLITIQLPARRGLIIVGRQTMVRGPL